MSWRAIRFLWWGGKWGVAWGVVSVGVGGVFGVCWRVIEAFPPVHAALEVLLREVAAPVCVRVPLLQAGAVGVGELGV
jgi:hypothetical protein